MSSNVQMLFVLVKYKSFLVPISKNKSITTLFYVTKTSDNMNRAFNIVMEKDDSEISKKVQMKTVELA